MAIKCDPRAYAKCPDREKCGPLQNAIFTDGSECDEFNKKVINAPPTNADRIRAMRCMAMADAKLKPCPIMIAGNRPSAMCIGADCAWWCGFANECAVPLLACMFADSEICRNTFEEQEGN